MLKIHKLPPPPGLLFYKKELAKDACYDSRGKEKLEIHENRSIVHVDGNTTFVNYTYNEEIQKGYKNAKEQTAFTELRLQLLEEQKFICCYCGDEIPSISNENDVICMKTEHFVPIDSQPNLQLTYHNLLAACKGNEDKKYAEKHCDTFKAAKALTFIKNPSLPEFRPIFAYKVLENEEKVLVFAHKNHPHRNEIDQEIKEILNLNENTLAYKRFTVWKAKIKHPLDKQKWTKSKISELLTSYNPNNQKVKLITFSHFLHEYLIEKLQKIE